MQCSSPSNRDRGRKGRDTGPSRGPKEKKPRKEERNTRAQAKDRRSTGGKVSGDWDRESEQAHTTLGEDCARSWRKWEGQGLRRRLKVEGVAFRSSLLRPVIVLARRQPVAGHPPARGQHCVTAVPWTLYSSRSLPPAFESEGGRKGDLAESDGGRKRESASMHDFCFTFPYGALLIVGGLVGFLLKGSLPSLMGGAGSGLVLSLAGYIQYKAYEKRTNSIPAVLLQIIVSIVLSAIMGRRWLETGHFMPPGLIAMLSFSMTVFYMIKVFSHGGNHFRRRD